MNGVDLAAHATEGLAEHQRFSSITGFATDAAMRRKTSNYPLLSKPFTCDQLTGKPTNERGCYGSASSGLRRMHTVWDAYENATFERIRAENP